MEEVRFVLPDGVGKRGAVDAGRERGYMVEGVAGNYARQFWDCRLAAPAPFCLWWPSFRGSLWFGGRSLRHGKGSRIGAAAAHALGPYHEFQFRVGMAIGWVVHRYIVRESIPARQNSTHTRTHKRSWVWIWVEFCLAGMDSRTIYSCTTRTIAIPSHDGLRINLLYGQHG